MRQLLAVVSVLGAVGALIRYFQASGNEFVLRLSAREIRNRLQSELPYRAIRHPDDRVELAQPRVRLIEGGDEVTVTLDLSVSDSGTESGPLVTGLVEFAAAVDYIPEQGSFYLSDPVIRRLHFSGDSPQREAAIRFAVHRALVEFCAVVAIRELREGEGPRASRQMVLTDVAVIDRGLILALDPP